MKLNIISLLYSHMGQFFYPVGEYKDKLSQALGGYSYNETPAQTSKGEAYKIYTFTKANRSVRFNLGRIDIEMGFNAYSSIEEFVEFVAEVSAKIAKIYQVKGNRIALNTKCFIPDNEGLLVDECCQKFNVLKVFKQKQNEFSLRVNQVSDIKGEKTNNVFKCEFGGVTNNATNEHFKCLFLNNDVNTVINNDARFAIDDADFYLTDFINIAEETNNRFISSLEEA